MKKPLSAPWCPWFPKGIHLLTAMSRQVSGTPRRAGLITWNGSSGRQRHHLEHLPLLLWRPQHGTSLRSAWVSGPGCVSSLKHLQLCVAEHCLQLKHHCVITAMFKDPKPSTIPATKKKINSIPDTQLSLWLNHFSPSSSPSPAVCYAVILM